MGLWSATLGSEWSASAAVVIAAALSAPQLATHLYNELHEMPPRISALTRVGELALGHTVNQLIVYGFDYGVYPLVILWLGLTRGFLVMALLSFAACWLTMRFYDWSKRDWLGIEAIKDIKEYNGPRRAAKALAWILRRSDAVACVLLSIKYDPFIVTVYLRRGRFGGMNQTDWRNFLLSWLISNVYWSIVCFGGVSALTWLWDRLKELI